MPVRLVARLGRSTCKLALAQRQCQLNHSICSIQLTIVGYKNRGCPLSRSCCTSIDRNSLQVERSEAARRPINTPAIFHATSPIVNAVLVSAGLAYVGTANPKLPDDGEGPLRRQKVPSLLWEQGAITVEAFARFVAATGYVTEAEKFGWSFVFYQHLPEPASGGLGVRGAEWWRQTRGAFWRVPTGPDGPPAEADHPVVHVSWNDACAYASWAGGRLPREAEWEHAARGGLGDVKFPWGDREPDDWEYFPCNIWQGRFPHDNRVADGYAATAPAISFSPNGYGLYNMVGNCWEWTADPFKVRSLKRSLVRNAQIQGARKLLKGGSFLCHKSYCFRYRIAAR